MSGAVSLDPSSSSVAASGSSTSLFPRNRMELSIALSEVDILLHPLPYDGVDETTAALPSKTIIVHAALSIPPTVDPPERIASMQVELRSDEVIGFPSSGVYERNKPHQINVQVDTAKDMPLQRGNVYQWDVPLTLSHRTAPYERGVYGRLFHKVIVTISWPGLSGWWKGGGRTLQCEQPVFIAAASRDASVLNYARTINGHARDIGPIVAHIRTRHLSVGGYARFALSLPRTSRTVDIQSVQLTMIQETTLYSRQEARNVERCTPMRITVWKQSRDELQTSLSQTLLQQDDEKYRRLQGEWIVRIPHDSQMRPSSLQGSESAFRHEHFLELSIAFRRSSSDDSASVFAHTTRWPIEIAPCGMLWRSVKLPKYSESDPSPVPEWSREAWEPDKFANIHVSQTVCACGQSTDKLLEWEREGDAEQNTITADALHEAIRTASAQRGTTSASYARSQSQSRSRSRSRNASGSAATSRSVSRRPSLDVVHAEEEMQMADGERIDDVFDEGGDESASRFSLSLEDDEEAEAVEQARRRRQKELQLYTPSQAHG